MIKLIYLIHKSHIKTVRKHRSPNSKWTKNTNTIHKKGTTNR